MKFFVCLSFIVISILNQFTLAGMLYGHNLSQTIETNKKGEMSLGSYVASYGLSNDIMIASSTWLYYDYNSWSAIIKKRFDSSAIQMAYIKSAPVQANFYQMETLMSWFVKRFEINDSYELNVNLNYMHFFDETLPFSFRREPGNDDPYQYSLSTLHRLKWSRNWGGLLEFGILGLNYVHPQIHSGFGFYYLSQNFLAQLGSSMTAVPYNIERFERTQWSREGSRLSQGYDFSVHPEIQIQFFL